MFSHSLQLSLFSDYSRLTTIFWLSLQHFYRANSLISVMKRPRDRNVCLSNAFIAPPIFSRTKFRWIRCCFGSIQIPICPMKATDWRKGRRRCKIIKTFLHSLFAFLNLHMHKKMRLTKILETIWKLQHSTSVAMHLDQEIWKKNQLNSFAWKKLKIIRNIIIDYYVNA